jgi:hypothetical protein
MSTTATSLATGVHPGERLEVLFDETAELTGQRNAIDARLVEIVAEMDRDELCGATGARSLPALVAWKGAGGMENRCGAPQRRDHGRGGASVGGVSALR